MSNNLWQNISCKYILKKVFSYIKVPRSLEIIKANKEIQDKLEISLYHYQYYYFFTLFKTEKIESINDILYSPYLKIFPENIKYELILKLIEVKKLFKNDYIYLDINDKNIIPLIKKVEEKKNINYIIVNIEEHKYKSDDIIKYHDNISYNIKMYKINTNKILFDYDYFQNINNKSLSQNVIYLNINLDEFSGNTYDISLFDNLEYLSLSLKAYNKYMLEEKIKIILSENQYKNIKTLKIIELNDVYYTIKNIVFETIKKNENNIFENLKELHINEKLINKIKFNPENLQKLNIVYDYRDYLYTIDIIENSIIDIIENYLPLTNLNISFFYKKNESNSLHELIEETSTLIFNSFLNLDNLSFDFWDLHESASYQRYFEYFKCSIKKIQNRKSKYKFKAEHIIPDFIESYLDKIEEIEFSGFRERKNFFAIEENNSISSITKMRINYTLNTFNTFKIQSFSSLNILSLEIENIILHKDFPLFSGNSLIKFNNLEYILLNTETIDIIINLTNNFDNIPNLRFLSLISKYICSTVFPYDREIINKCVKLRKLHTLIINDTINSNINKANIYYKKYPELKNTNIRFCVFSNNLMK